MTYEPGSPKQIIEERIARLIDDLDELCALATDSKTVALVEGQRIAVGQIANRSHTLTKLLLAVQPPQFRVLGRA